MPIILISGTYSSTLTLVDVTVGTLILSPFATVAVINVLLTIRRF